MASPSWQDLYDVGVYVAQARRPRLVVNQGDVTDAIIAGCATCCDVAQGENARRFRSTYLDGADDEDLTVEASDRGVDRDLGDQAVGQVTLARPTAAAGGGTVFAGTTVATVADVNGTFSSYTTDTDAVFGALDLSKTVDVTCTVDGPQGRADVGTVTRILGSVFDASLTCTNSDRIDGGANAESDPDLRDRTRGFFKTQARGTEEAIIYGAKTVPGVKRASVSVNPSTGEVVLYVADENGNANATLVADVVAVMPEWAAVDSLITVVGGTQFLQAIDVSITVRTGTDINALLDRIRNAIVSRLLRLNPGETLYRDMIRDAVIGVDRQNILQVDVNTPAANVTPSASEAIRTTIDLITNS